MPGMIHLHWPLRQPVQWESAAVDPCFLEWHVPKWQRVEIGDNPFAVGCRRPYASVALRGETEPLQWLEIKLQDDRIRRIDKSHPSSGLEIGLVGVFEIKLVLGKFMLPKTPIRDIALQLMRVWGASARILALGSSPAAQRPDSGSPLVIDDILGVTARVSRSPLRSDKPRQSKPRTDFDEHVLKRP